MQINLTACAPTILNEITQGVSQKDIALTYAMAIKSEMQKADAPDWAAINHAIIQRWSLGALNRIKMRAWGIYEGRIKP